MAKITTVLDLDISQFSSKASAAGHVLSETLSADTNKVLKRKFGYDDALKGLLMGAGMGGVEQIAEKIAEHWKTAAEAAKEIAESSKRTLDNYLSAFAARRTDAQNLDFNRKEQARLQRELAGLKPEETTRSVLNPDFTVRTFTEVTDTAKAKAAARRTEIVEELSKLAKEEADLSKKVSETKKQDAEKIEAARKRFHEAEREAQMAGIEKTAKLRRLEEERRNLMFELDGLDESTAAHFEKRAEIAKTELEIARTRLDISRDEEQLEQKRAQHAQALKNYGEAAANMANARHDQLGFSLEDAASGKRGSSTDRARARGILLLEKRARRLYDRNEEIMDPSGRLEMSGEMVMERARDLRRGFSRLTSVEQDPLRNAAKALDNAGDKLTKAAADLAKVEAVVEVAP